MLGFSERETNTNSNKLSPFEKMAENHRGLSILLNVGFSSFSCRERKHQDNHLIVVVSKPYVSGYKTEFFSLQNNPKDLDQSYKMDLNLEIV